MSDLGPKKIATDYRRLLQISESKYVSDGTGSAYAIRLNRDTNETGVEGDLTVTGSLYVSKSSGIISFTSADFVTNIGDDYIVNANDLMTLQSKDNLTITSSTGHINLESTHDDGNIKLYAGNKVEITSSTNEIRIQTMGGGSNDDIEIVAGDDFNVSASDAIYMEAADSIKLQTYNYVKGDITLEATGDLWFSSSDNQFFHSPATDPGGGDFRFLSTGSDNSAFDVLVGGNIELATTHSTSDIILRARDNIFLSGSGWINVECMASESAIKSDGTFGHNPDIKSELRFRVSGSRIHTDNAPGEGKNHLVMSSSSDMKLFSHNDMKISSSDNLELSSVDDMDINAGTKGGDNLIIKAGNRISISGSTAAGNAKIVLGETLPSSCGSEPKGTLWVDGGVLKVCGYS